MLTHVAILPLVDLLLHPAPVPQEPIVIELVSPPERRPTILPTPRPKLPTLAKRPRAIISPHRQTDPKPPPPKPPQRHVKRPRPQPRPQPPSPPRLKMVEVNNPETDRAPKHARFLSDKNRRVLRETRARHTALIKVRPDPILKDTHPPHPREAPERKALRHRRLALRRPPRPKQPTPKRRHVARSKPRKRALLQRLTMRRVARPKIERAAPVAPRGDLLAAQNAQRAQRARRRRRLDLNLDDKALDRIYGKAATRERERARLSPSPRRAGKTARKWKRMRAALENFIPEVQPGNQTALGTRANPFAVYIARMHRTIHPLWGYGFLADLNSKADNNPLNNMRLRVTMEVVVNPDGTVAKATIVRPSGNLVYDVAAIDTIFSAGPYPHPPKAIRSANDKVYLHWSFYRNHRQCGTFNVHPYILTTPPRGPIDGKTAQIPSRRRLRRLHQRLRQGPRAADATLYRPGERQPSSPKGLATPTSRHRASQHRASRPQVAPPPVNLAGLSPADLRRRLRAARAAARRVVSSADPRAWIAARRLVAAFAHGDARAMARSCALPFHARGQVVATTRRTLTQMFANLLAETRSRHTGDLAILSTFEARRRIGQLPRGVHHGRQMLIGHVRLGGTPFTMTLRRVHQHWRIIGLDR